MHVARCDPVATGATMRTRIIAKVSSLTWNTFRDHRSSNTKFPNGMAIIGRPNIYIPASRAADGPQDEAAARPFRLAAVQGLVRRRRPSWAWRACAAWNVARPRASRRPSTAESYLFNERTFSSDNGRSKMRVMVTGHLGYIGTVMVPMLLQGRA